MAEGQVTISHPSNAFDPIVLECFNNSGYKRINPGAVQVGARTSAGIMTIESASDKYVWTFGVDLSYTAAMHLAFIIQWQDRSIVNRQDGTLWLTDEVLYALPEASVNPNRPLISTAIANSIGWRYGYARFKVKLQMPNDAMLTIIGQDTETQRPRIQFIFSAEEI